MKKAVVYARYSSESQTEQSIEGQLRVCKQYAQNNSILILDTYIDRAMTGTNDLRPSFQKMIKDSAKRQWDYVIVYKLDRFSRNKYESTIHKKTLKDNGVKLLSAMENIPDTPEGIILESLLEGMNQYYSAELSQKVRRGLKESWIKGNYTGGTLIYGYDIVNKKYVINETEAAIVKEIYIKYSQGYTAVSIGTDLQKRGIRNKQGYYMTSKHIYKILTNSKYTGKAKYGGQVYTHIIPPLITEELWRKVNNIHEANKHAPGRKKDIYDFLLSGKLVCGECKHLMVGESGTSMTGNTYYYYSCLSRRRKKAPCSLKSINKQWLEDIVINITWNMLSNKELVYSIAENLYRLIERENKNNAVLKSLEAQRAAAIKASNNLIRAIEEGIITEQTKTRLKELEAQINNLDFDIEQEKFRSYTYLSMEIIESYLNSLICGKADNIETRKALVKTFIREIIYYPDKIIITYNFSDHHDEYKISSKNVEETIKQSEEAAFSLDLSSYKYPPSAPK